MQNSEKKPLKSHCPINFSVEMFGDKWSLLIIRDIVFWGKRTYGEFLNSDERIATNVLALRLVELEKKGLLLKTADPDDNRKAFYKLTEKGLDLIPLLLAMVSWSEKYDSKSQAKKQRKFVLEIRNEVHDVAARIRHQVQNGDSVFAQRLSDGTLHPKQKS